MHFREFSERRGGVYKTIIDVESKVNLQTFDFNVLVDNRGAGYEEEILGEAELATVGAEQVDIRQSQLCVRRPIISEFCIPK